MREIRQQAEGDNITQAGRDINISTSAPVFTGNLIPCPDCQSPTSRFAPMCPICSFPVASYFEGIQIRAQSKRNAIITSAVGITSILVAAGMLYYTVPSFVYREYVPVGAVAVAFALGTYRYIVFKVTKR